MRHLSPTLAAVLLSVAILSSPAQANEAASSAFISAESEFLAAVAGQSAATERSLKLFTALAATPGPLQALYQAYLGSTQALQGRDAWLPWTKLKTAEKGLNTLDKVLNRLDPASERIVLRGVPITLEIRLVAAATFLAVPDRFFHRNDQGRQMLDELLRSPRFAATPAVFRSRTLRQAALGAQLRDDRRSEIAFLRQAVASAGSSVDVTACQHRLQELGA